MQAYGPVRWDKPRRAGSPVTAKPGRWRALSLGPGIDPMHFHGTVHSVFGRALNIELDSGRLAALVAPEMPNAPATIRADLGGGGFHAIARPGDVAACRAGILRFAGGSAIDLRAARIWHPRRPSGRPNRAAWQGLYKLAIAAPQYSALGAWPGLETCENPHRFAGLAGDELITTLAPLIGLGPGLTPAGDDFTAGLAAALCWSGGRSILAPHLPGWAARTTLVSRWLLLDSLSGQVSEPVCDLAQALHGNLAAPAPQAVLKLGHTSGLALALGLLAGYAFAWPGLARRTEIGLTA
jgi:hypothetical protein